MSNSLENCIVLNQDDDYDYTVIWMHGLGADANDFVPVAKMLPDEIQTRTRFIFPNAPMQPVTINQGYVMQAWYDIKEMDLFAEIDEQGMHSSVNTINAMIDSILTERPDQKIILAGFSQGGVIALIASLINSHVVGTLALSTYLPFWPENASKTIAPTFIGHGLHDPIVPYQAAHLTQQKLFAHQPSASASIEMKTYPMEHSVSEEEIEDIAQWFIERYKQSTLR